jgi:hypothetical protein
MLFFFLMLFSYLNMKQIGLGGKELFRIMNPRTVTVQRISCNASYQPSLLFTANLAVRGNSVFKIILPGITSSRTQNPPEEWLPRMWPFAVFLYLR